MNDLKKNTENGKSFFDGVARNYREIHDQSVKITGGNSEAFAAYKPMIMARILAQQEVNSILDLGCGDGLSEIYFRQFFPNVRLLGFDVSSESIAVANRRQIQQCSFSSFDGEDLPVSDQQIDVVFMSCVLHHVPHSQHKKLLSECARVLKPGGKLFIFEHNPLNPLTRKVVRECIFDCDAELIPAGQLKKVVLSAGFCCARVFYTLFFPRNAIFKPLHRIEKYMTYLPVGGQYYIYAISVDAPNEVSSRSKG